MTDKHILIYATAVVLVASVFCFFYSRIKLGLFDSEQSVFLGGNKVAILMEFLICASVVLGIRGVGVVLVSSFFVAPAAFSLRFCKTLKSSIITAILMAASVNVMAFSLPLKTPIGPLLVLLLSCLAILTLRKKTDASLS